MFTITEDIKKKIRATAQKMLEEDLTEMKIEKEGTNITTTLLKAGHVPEALKHRVSKEYAFQEETFYLVI